MRRIAAVFAALALLAGPAAAVEANLEELLRSDNPAQIRQALAIVTRDAGRIDPVNLFLLAAKLQQQKENDEALFWFFAAQLRMRYVLAVAPDETRGQVFVSMTAGLGMAIYPAFEMKEERIAATIDRVLAWDRKTPVDFSWLGAKLQVPSQEWPAKFVPIREGLVKLKAQFLALPKDECERLRQGMGDWRKGREDTQRGWNSESNRRRVEAGFSTGLATVTTGGIGFRLPKSFISPFGMDDAVDFRERDIGIQLFLPDLSGYTRDNWSDFFNPDKLRVNILPNAAFNFMTQYPGLVARAGAPLGENAGLKVYAHPSAHKCYPEQILAGELADGAPVFINCRAMNEPYASCSAYFYAPGGTYTLSMGLTPARLPQWRELVRKVAALVESWRHAAR